MSQESSFESSGSVQYKPKQALPSATSPRKFSKDKRSKSANSRSRVSSPGSGRVRAKSNERFCRRFTSPTKSAPRSMESIKRESILSYKAHQRSSTSSSMSKDSGGSSLSKNSDNVYTSQEIFPHITSSKEDRKNISNITPPIATGYSFTSIDTIECLNVINSNYLGANRSKSFDDKTHATYRRAKVPRSKPKGQSRPRRLGSSLSDPPLQTSTHAQYKPLAGPQTDQVGILALKSLLSRTGKYLSIFVYLLL